ncbi:MAG: transposase [Ruminococcus sp.]|nr:transposase [Ruminococcus sp.]
MAYFVLQLHLKTEIYQEHILNKRFEIGRQIYNAIANVTQKRYHEMIKTKRYRELIANLTHNEKKDKPIWKKINEIREEYRMTKKEFLKDVKNMQKHFKKNIDSQTAQKIAASVWKAYEKLFYGNGEKIHYKRYGELNSLESNSNLQGIRFRKDRILWNGLDIPVAIDNNNTYEQQALQNPIAYCRIIRKYIRNKFKYYLQIVFKGNPPVKINEKTGMSKHPIGKGDVGLDIGTSTIAIASQTDVKILELADKVQRLENEKRVILRKMDRSRRAMNPQNYNPDGTIKKQGNQKVIWKKSNHYLNCQNQLKEIYRKQADVRKYQHECLANAIISLGDKICVEKMNFAGLQKRAKKTEKNTKGKFKRKKRFGKSLANKAPAMLLEIIHRKLGYFGKELVEINTFEARASQFNHVDGTYQKKKLSQRWTTVDGIRVQRDMYSAFLIMNVNSDLKTFDIEKCHARFEDFKMLHDREVMRLSGHKNLSSIAI